MRMTEKEYNKAIKILQARERKSGLNLSNEEIIQKLKDRLKRKDDE